MRRDSAAARLRRRLLVFAGALALCAALAAPAGAALPVHYSAAYGTAYALAHPGAAPPGANDWSCRPSAAHPRPVVLVHGTFANMTINWTALSPLLKNAGYCVFAFNYGQEAGRVLGFPGASPPGGTGPVEDSARQLAAFVDRVRGATGAARVDLVGHSQGGMMPRYYLRFLGGAAKVHALVGLAPSNHGTTLGGLGSLVSLLPGGSAGLGAACGAACSEQLAGSPFITALNAGHETEPGVAYTVIESRYDEVVTPYTSAFLSGPGVTNIRVQDGCPLDASDHLAIAFDRRALRDVLNALDPAHAVAAPCVVVLPGEGG